MVCTMAIKHIYITCVWELKDRGTRKIIIFIIIKDMHVECVGGWMVFTYIYIYITMAVVFGKYESGRINYV